MGEEDSDSVHGGDSCSKIAVKEPNTSGGGGGADDTVCSKDEPKEAWSSEQQDAESLNCNFWQCFCKFLLVFVLAFAVLVLALLHTTGDGRPPAEEEDE